ncbi:hypothetical protein O3P69_005827 [Scylla paramamosain]|uniref:Uncharacterized protein n=1 Tax=Scylla paramamosain TaxID=85552 RepID=A0AAW0U5F3_SCYPA
MGGHKFRPSRRWAIAGFRRIYSPPAVQSRAGEARVTVVMSRGVGTSPGHRIAKGVGVAIMYSQPAAVAACVVLCCIQRRKADERNGVIAVNEPTAGTHNARTPTAHTPTHPRNHLATTPHSTLSEALFTNAARFDELAECPDTRVSVLYIEVLYNFGYLYRAPPPSITPVSPWLVAGGGGSHGSKRLLLTLYCITTTLYLRLYGNARSPSLARHSSTLLPPYQCISSPPSANHNAPLAASCVAIG